MVRREALSDIHGRSFQYLRLSVTDACNFRCIYCLPGGYRGRSDGPGPLGPLGIDEIGRLIAAFAGLGVWKVRLTGGEPTLRRDIVGIAERVGAIAGIRKVALTTNGYRLKELAWPLKRAGVSGVNVSVDSLDPGRFKSITGRDALGRVLEGVDAALESGFAEVKLNVVLLRGMNDAELEGYLELVRARSISVRFIELMRTGVNAGLFQDRHLAADSLKASLLAAGWNIKERQAGGGPAVEFTHPEHRGSIGLIAPYSKDFCAGCNRLRVTSQGALRLCLFGESDYPLRPLLQSRDSCEELTATITGLLKRKPPSHYLNEGRYGNTWNLAAIGG